MRRLCSRAGSRSSPSGRMGPLVRAPTSTTRRRSSAGGTNVAAFRQLPASTQPQALRAFDPRRRSASSARAHGRFSRRPGGKLAGPAPRPRLAPGRARRASGLGRRLRRLRGGSESSSAEVAPETPTFVLPNRVETAAKARGVCTSGEDVSSSAASSRDRARQERGRLAPARRTRSCRCSGSGSPS